MTAGSAHNRWLQHRDGHRRHNLGNALHRHDVEHHNGECQAYTAKIVTREISLLTLTVREAILQEHQKEEFSMNDRIEMGRGGGIIRIRASRPG